MAQPTKPTSGNVEKDIPKPNVFAPHSPEQVEKFTEMIDKTFVKKDGSDKDAFWKVTAAFPVQPADFLGTEFDFRTHFNVAKFSKKDFVTVDKKKTYASVKTWDENGRVLDEEGNFSMDAEKFLERFKREDI